MNIVIPAELEQFVQSVIRRGSYESEAEVVGEALRLLKKREQLCEDVNAGIGQLDQGKGIDGEEVFERLEKKAEAISRQAAADDE